MITPLLKKIIESEKLTKYFLTLSLVFAFVIPELITVLTFFSEKAGRTLSTAVNNMRLNFVLGFTFYYILGFCFTKIKLTKKQHILLGVCGAAGFISTILLTFVFTRRTGAAVNKFYDNMTVNVMLCSVFLFSLAEPINRIHFSDRAKAVIFKLSKYSFGASQPYTRAQKIYCLRLTLFL